MKSSHTDTQIIENTNLDEILKICNSTPFNNTQQLAQRRFPKNTTSACSQWYGNNF